MKVAQAVEFHLQYHRANSKKNTVKTCEFVLSRFSAQFGIHGLASISHEEVLAFLLSLTKNNKQATKRNRYPVLSSFYNFSINTALSALTNPCSSAVIKKIFKRPQAIQWQIVDKETVDESIIRTTNKRNRLMLELMARGGMRNRRSFKPSASRYTREYTVQALSYIHKYKRYVVSKDIGHAITPNPFCSIETATRHKAPPVQWWGAFGDEMVI